MIYSLFVQSGTGFALASRQLVLDKYRGAVATMALLLVLAGSAIAGSPMASAQDAVTPAPVTTVNINTADALTLAKLDRDFKTSKCDSSIVQDHYVLGRDVGLNGTPAIVFDDGTMVGGYLPPDQLAARLAQNAAQQ